MNARGPRPGRGDVEPIGQAGDIPALTGVRAVACFWVLLSHIEMGYKPGLPDWMISIMRPGYLGVDLFFILSGFILARVYATLRFQPAAIGGFYLKRLFRVYPLDIFMMLFMAADAWTIGAIGPGWYDPRGFLPILLMIQPFFLHHPLPFGWLATNWSVGVELLCYLFFPVLAVLGRTMPRLALAFGLVALLIAEALTQHHFLAHAQGAGAILRGVCGFVLGGLCLCLVQASPRPSARVVAVLAWVSLAVIGILLAMKQPWLIPPCMALLIVSLSYSRGLIANVLSTRLMVWLGDISFSLYLVHGVLLGRWGWRWLEAFRGFLPDPLASLVWFGLFLAATVALSWFTYRAIEYPARSLGRLTARRAARPLVPAAAAPRAGAQGV